MTSDDDAYNRLLWTPSKTQIEDSLLYGFVKHCGADHHDYAQFLQWSVDKAEDFWTAVWNYCGIIGDKGDIVIDKPSKMPGARFFPDSRLSYAENMLARVKTHADEPALIYRHQGGEDRILSWQNLYDEVSRWQQLLQNAGLEKGERIGVYLPNVPETIIIFLAASNIGAVFSSAGMEMGSDDLVNRFGQISPKILISGEGYKHGDKEFSRLDVVARAQNEISSIEQTIIVPQLSSAPAFGGLENTALAADLLRDVQADKIDFARHDFNHPLYILFSSGSTGKPKCFEHSSGGVLLKHASEFQLSSDIRAGDRVFYHATPSWMMWNWLVGGLANGAAILLHDGSPAYPGPYVQWDFTADHGCTHHGTAAPLIMSWDKQGLDIARRYGAALAPLRAIMSTGAVLPPRGFEYIHAHIKDDIKIASISGGTDMVGCFMGGNPFVPTYAGCLNGPMPGMDVRILGDEGAPVKRGQTGELCCFNVFPSMPLRFLDDEGGARYRAEYFEDIDGAWRHGDSVTLTRQGQMVIVGRSDATLNQGGVRVGTSAIYDQVDAVAARGEFAGTIRDSAAASFMAHDGEARTVLFLAADEVGDELAKAIRDAVKKNVTPYAIPAEIIAVPDILKTPNGKKAEVVIKKIINGATIPNPSLYGADLVTRFEEIAVQLKEKYS